VNVLDAFAIVALLKGEPGGERIQVAIDAGDAAACSINLGEVLYTQARGGHEAAVLDAVEQLRRQIETVEPDWALVKAAASLKARYRLSYADAFCIATARRLDAALWTGDPEILTLTDVGVELVPLG
jgi:predicted nucleic acid-binding protein